MRYIIVFVGMALSIYLLILIYEFVEKTAIHIGFEVYKAHVVFWLLIIVSIGKSILEYLNENR